jgi:DNA-binding transcriptional MocR family regulator
MEVYMNVEDIGKQLNVSTSTIKKYYLLIEDRGYIFRRNKHSQINFTREDLDLFRVIFELKSQPKTTINEAIDKALAVITKDTVRVDDKTNTTYNEHENNIDMTVITAVDEKLSSLISYMEKQEATIQRQNLLIQEQGRILNELERTNKQKLLEYDDKNSLLQENLSESNEIKEMLERLEKKVDKVERKRWWKFW